MKRHRLVAALLAFGVALAGTAILSAAPEGLAGDLTALGSLDPDIRKSTMSKLQDGGAEMASALIDELDGSHSATVKGAIAQVVQGIGASNDDAADLRAQLASNDPVVRKAAAVILCSNPSLATSELISVATNAAESASIRVTAIRALGGAGTSAASTLTALANDGKLLRTLRAAAMVALAETSEAGAKVVKKIADKPERTNDDRVMATRALGAESSQGHSELKSLATSPSADVRKAALVAIGGVGDTTLLATVAGRMADADAEVRLIATQTTISMGGETTHKATIKGLIADADPRVQSAAIQSVARSYKGTPATVKNALKLELANANFRVRYEAALALLAHGDKSGAATMAADKLTPNQSQAQLASKAHTQITGK